MGNQQMQFCRTRPAATRSAAWHRIAHLWPAVLVSLAASLAAAEAPPATQPTPEMLGQLGQLVRNVLDTDGPVNDEGEADATDPAQPPAPPGQDEPPPPPPAPKTGASGSDQDIRLTDTGLLEVHVKNADISTVLEWLSYEAHASIVTTTSVSGTVSANLYGVTLEQALAAILLPNNYAFYADSGTIFVGTPDEIDALRPPQPLPVTRVLQLKFLSPREAATAVSAVLSEQARIVEGGEGGTTGTGELGSTTVSYIVVTDTPQRVEAAAALLAEIDRRPPQVLIEATILRATLNESNQLGIDFTMLGGVDFQNVNSISDASSNLITGQLPPDRLQDTTFNINTDFARNVGEGGFTFGIIKDSIAAFVRALEEVTDTVVVANPKIATLNRQEAEVIVGRRDGYLTTTVTDTAAVQTVEFLETGTQIKFQPIINGDGTVRLAVHPKDSNGGLTAANLPFEETTEAHADILVEDGHTVLIGGLFRDRTVRSRSQVPFFGDIPVLGYLVASEGDTTVREEVIILLTVHILKNTPEEQEKMEGLLNDVELVRIGARRGLMGWGRQRLAQAFYHQAVSDLEKGKDKLALFNVRLALHNQPDNLAALKLEERLTGRRLWDEEGTRMHTFIWTLINPPDGVGSPPFGRPDVSSWVPSPIREGDNQ